MLRKLGNLWRLAAQLPTNVSDERWWRSLGVAPAVTAAGVAVTVDNALSLDVVQCCIDNLAGPISSLPWMVFERISDDERRPATDHPLYRVLKRPNPRQTTQEFRDELQRHLAFWRNGYARILPGDDGTPIGALEPIHPKRVLKVEASDGRVYYTVSRLGQAGTDTYRDDEIWHIRKAPLTDDGLQGRPVYETGKEVIGRALAVKDYGSRWFVNSGKSGGVLKHPGNFKSKEDEQSFMESWRAAGTGVNARRDRLLKFGVDYQPISANNDEGQFIETFREENIALCRLWNMPPHRVAILERATFSNIEQQSIEYVVHTLAPWIAAWEQAAARDLLIDDDQERYYVEFNVAGLLRGDVVSQFNAFAQGRQWGWFSVNDIRRLLNMDPIGPEGDEYLRPVNMTPAGTPATGAPSQQPQPRPNQG